jgi:hypothetical protein
VISNIDLREAVRLRADSLWASKRYPEAAEQIELLHGAAWKDFEPLSDPQRADILRAAIGYALGEDALSLARLRERYGPKMMSGPDRRAFDVATAPLGSKAAEFSEISKVAAFDTLDDFLREMRTRFPEIGPVAPAPDAKSDTKPETKPDLAPTGSVQRRLATR